MADKEKISINHNKRYVIVYRKPVNRNEIWLLFTVPVTSNASRHFKSPLAMGEMPFKTKRASSVSISVVIDTGVNSNEICNNLLRNM